MVAVGFVSGYRGRDSARTARCAVRAAFSGASTCPGQRGARSVPPAARGRGRRSAASLPTNYVRTVNRYLLWGGEGEHQLRPSGGGIQMPPSPTADSRKGWG